ncbi:hypothetical protein AALO_G00298090 [Alosa alosa]|uniref:Uncharacterized protein n=1 Tax=Alosa alosa TaxID=278164 RepID=A0AAV6FDU1_9TELE|nr:hypothetical protein AALO_G00298090 [Alosa alosa]
MLQDHALSVLLDLGGREEPPKFLQSFPAQGEEDEEAQGGEEPTGGQMVKSLTECTTDSQSSLPKESVSSCAVPAAPALSEVAGPSPKALTHLDATKNKAVTPCPAKQRRFMVYICGGYRDTVTERQALRENVYPRLYLYCKQRGYDFKMVDLRLGVPDPITEQNDSVELHLETLRECQETEAANFFVFAGQKHEVPTPPLRISQHAFESILKVVECDRKKRSRRRPQLDDELSSNSQSSVTPSDAESSFARGLSHDQEDLPQGSAMLISSETTVSQTSLSDGEDTGLARGWVDFDRDLTLLLAWYKLDENRVPAEYRLLPVSTHHPDFLSRDGQRRRRGRKAWRTSCRQLWAVLRRCAPVALGEEAAAHLLRTVLDWEVEQGLSTLSPPEAFCHCYKRIIPDLLYNLCSEHAANYIDLLKGQGEVNPTLHAAHQRTIQNIHSKLRHTNIYERNVGWGRRGLSPKHNRSHLFYTERLCSHFQRTVTSSLNRDKGHVFRQEVLMEIRRVVEGAPQTPVIVLGEPGWGKSTTLAKVALLMPSWIPGELRTLLGLASAERPAVLVLDGLDELSEEHQADVSWLCGPLPLHVYAILSATTNSTAALELQKRSHAQVIYLPPLTPEEVSQALELMLEADGRRLQPQQWQLLQQACLSCPSPLFLEAACFETRAWSSFSPQERLILPGDLAKLYGALLARLEREHGEQLVLREVDTPSHQPSTSSSSSDSLPRVPSVLWAHLRRAFGPHLTEVESDGTWLHRWSHLEFGRVVVQRYLRSEDCRRVVHADFADYYRGRISGRHTEVFQPLAWVLNEGEERRKNYVFNLRKLHGLPYHLVHSGQIMPLMDECIFNYEFLLHKAWGLSVLHIEEDLKAAVIPDKELLDVQVLSQVLLLSRAVLLQDPCQLASQLLGRLAQIVSQDKPVAPGDPYKFTYLHSLLAQCQRSSLPTLVPSFTCLLPPGGLVYTLITGHTTPVTAIAGGQHGSIVVTCSSEGSLRLWDLELDSVVQMPTGNENLLVADSLTLCLSDRLVAITKGHCLQVRELSSGKVLYSESESLDVPVVTCASEGKLLVVFYDGSQMVKAFDLTASCKLLCRTSIALESDPIHKDRSILVSRNSVKDNVLFAYRSGREAAVLSARGGSVVATLKAQHPSATIQAVEMTPHYLLVFCSYPYKSQGDIIHIELFSTTTFQYQRSILGCGQDLVSQLTVTRAGSHVVAFCPSARSGTTDIIVWNLETEDHKHLARFPGLIAQGMCFDLRFCLGFCRGERFLRLWNLVSRLNDQSLTYNSHRVRRDGTKEVIPLGKVPRYVLCRSMRPGTIRVWNVARPRLAGHPVRVEHGLFTNTDVALARDLKLYILTGRGTSSFTESATPVYQTLLVYDLLKRSYIKKQTGLFVVPCPQNDYTMLKDQVLLGLSDTRDHLILWDLDSGYIKGRIKPSHKESLLSNTPVRDRKSQIIPVKDHKVFQLVMPWDRRMETHTAKRRRLEREAQREKEEQWRLDQEKFNAVDQYLLSGDEQVVVCSYFAHHLSVFCMSTLDHMHTLEDRSSLLNLQTAALTHTGGHLVISNYSEAQHTPYLTLWDLKRGMVRKRLKNEPGVCCVAMTNDASRVAFGIAAINKIKVWDPFKRKHKTISGYGSLQFGVVNQLFLVEEGAKAILLAGELSMWDLNAGTVLSVFTPDSTIQCVSLLGDANNTILLGFSDDPTLITVRLSNTGVVKATPCARREDLFGESSSSEDEQSGH